MKTLKELRARLTELQAQAAALKEKALDDWTDEDVQASADIPDEIDSIRADIQRLERFERTTDQLNEPAGRRTAAPRIEPGQDALDKDEWCGFEGATDYCRAVMRASQGQVDPRLMAIPDIMGAPSNYHQERGADEGYMVPPAVRDGVWEVVTDTEDISNDVDDEPTGSNAVTLFADEDTPWGSTGIQANWASEGNQFSATKLSTKKRLVQLHKLYAFALTTDEMLDDAPRLFDRLTRKAGLAIVWKSSEAIFNGSGAGQPLGFMNAGCLVSVAKEGSQAAATLLDDNVAKMYARQLNPGRAVWYVNQDVLPQLITMQLGDQPIWTPPGSGLQGAPGGLLLGRPIRFSEHCQTLGTKGDVVFVDPMGYYLPRKDGTQFARSIHLYFDYDIEAFRWTFRLGGQPYLESAVSPAKGSNTRSHFVSLDTRA